MQQQPQPQQQQQQQLQQPQQPQYAQPQAEGAPQYAFDQGDVPQQAPLTPSKCMARVPPSAGQPSASARQDWSCLATSLEGFSDSRPVRPPWVPLAKLSTARCPLPA